MVTGVLHALRGLLVLLSVVGGVWCRIALSLVGVRLGNSFLELLLAIL
jgi:hypothetical protein